ncbi:Bipolar DNA helicase [Methylophaga thiooxydans]|uniref:Bipolar DNA helicase n=1 Tax=Methylophaga thiooxydans TaxID=392484 RepID=A0A0A0BGW3_9GAMM|nr:ATP-binding protein [Methylophaga thiooxydans]KGM06937.1 Bipolar DNA helicase [Methylophaga thiooxydans]
MSVAIGEVVSVRGVSITIELYEESNKETLFYGGEKFKGVSIREHLVIKRGFRDIVTIVQGEHLDERNLDEETKTYTRKVELKPIGFYQDGKFHEGIKYLPMILDIAYLMSEAQVKQVYSGNGDSGGFVIGSLLKEELPISLPWTKLFNTHIGVFGNTGSGKSNTLANLYTTLFSNKNQQIEGKSQFLIIDFNGEYTGNQLMPQGNMKSVIDLDTRGDGGDKFKLTADSFWDVEVFGILFKATENTQKPFLSRLVRGREKYADNPKSLQNYTRSTIKRALTSTAAKKEFAELIEQIANIINYEELAVKARSLGWYAQKSNLYINWGDGHLNGGEDDKAYQKYFADIVDELVVPDLAYFDELLLRLNLQLLSDLVSNYVQFEHIQPLLKRVEASISSFNKLFEISEPPTSKLLTVVSLRKCNQEVKKVIPLLIAKFYYEKHKNDIVDISPPNKTFHLIIDEAHNVLSMQSARESESWKDYRIELFEEIIKEGRKFGFYLTLSSQRPADISPTIMSQLHNFFIHRLVNDRDILLLENTISTLDSHSRSLIPNLARGCAVITGTSFEIPMVVQFNQLPLEHQPDSDDVNLKELWN